MDHLKWKIYGKSRILKVKYILLEVQKDLKQLNDNELKDKETKIRKEIHELFTKTSTSYQFRISHFS